MTDKYNILGRVLPAPYAKLHDLTMDQLNYLFRVLKIWNKKTDCEQKSKTIENILQLSYTLDNICVLLEKSCPLKEKRIRAKCLEMHKQILYGSVLSCFAQGAILSPKENDHIQKLCKKFMKTVSNFRMLAESFYVS